MGVETNSGPKVMFGLTGVCLDVGKRESNPKVSVILAITLRLDEAYKLAILCHALVQLMTPK
jgi:hypothetical protein